MPRPTPTFPGFCSPEPAAAEPPPAGSRRKRVLVRLLRWGFIASVWLALAAAVMVVVVRPRPTPP